MSRKLQPWTLCSMINFTWSVYILRPTYTRMPFDKFRHLVSKIVSWCSRFNPKCDDLGWMSSLRSLLFGSFFWILLFLYLSLSSLSFVFFRYFPFTSRVLLIFWLLSQQLTLVGSELTEKNNLNNPWNRLSHLPLVSAMLSIRWSSTCSQS